MKGGKKKEESAPSQHLKSLTPAVAPGLVFFLVPAGHAYASQVSASAFDCMKSARSRERGDKEERGTFTMIGEIEALQNCRKYLRTT